MNDDIATPGEQPAAVYRRHLEEGRLVYQYSLSLKRAIFYPRLVSPVTGLADLQWRVASGRGTVHATTVIYPREGSPYNVALVECEEGFRLMTRVEDIDPEAVAIGQRVRLRIAPPFAGEPVEPLFIPEGDEA